MNSSAAENSVPIQSNGASLLKPAEAGERIASIDVLRGVAVLGILLMNIIGFGLPWPAYIDPSTLGGGTGWNLYSWIITNMLFEGTMRTIFSMLFGAGVILITSRAEARGANADIADIYYRRTLWLVVFGVIHAYLLLWDGDILYTYGLVGLMLFPFRKMEPKRLAWVGFAFFAAMLALNAGRINEMQSTRAAAVEAEAAQAAGAALTEAQLAGIAAWEEKFAEFKPSDEALQETIGGYLSPYWENVASHAPMVAMMQTEIFYYEFFWDAAFMMFLGMAFLKWGVFSAQLPASVYWTMIGFGYAAGLSLNGFETWYYMRNNFDVFDFLTLGYTYNIGRFLVSLGHIGVVMLLCKYHAFEWLLARLGAAGRMALTNYIMQTVICVTLFNGFGFGWFGQLQRYELYYVVFGVWVFQLAVSPVWLRHFRFGPMEWLWRSLTYCRWQPMRRESAQEPQYAPA